MPFRPDDSTELTGVTGHPPPPEPEFTTGDVIAAAARQNNTFVSAMQRWRNSGTFTPEANHSTYDTPGFKGSKYEQVYSDRFWHSVSKAQDESLMRQIDQEEHDKSITYSAGWPGVIAGMAAGTVDPVMFMVPGVWAMKLGKSVGFGARASAAATGGVTMAAQELALHATQETRTPGESVVNIASGAILGGLIGHGAHSMLNREEVLHLTSQLNKERQAMEEHATGVSPHPASSIVKEADEIKRNISEIPPGQPRVEAGSPVAAAAVGAATPDVRKLESVSTGLEKIPGVGWMLEHAGPLQRALGSSTLTGRRIAADLSEVTRQMQEHWQGVPMTYNGAVETVARLRTNSRRIQYGDALDEAYAKYRGIEKGVIPVSWQSRVQDLFGGAEDKLNRSRFSEEVTRANFNGDRHSIPEVQEAAQVARKIYDQSHKEAIEAKLLTGEEDGGPDASYAHRIWNNVAIAAKKSEFIRTVANWYMEEQATKAEAQARLRVAHDRLLKAETRIAKAEARIEKLKADGEADPSMPKSMAAWDELHAASSLRDSAWRQIEDEIGRWEGKTTKEAKAALKRRAEYEKQKTDEGTPSQERLEAADKAMKKAVKDIIKSDRNLPYEDLQARATETANRILGSAAGRLPYDLEKGALAMVGHPRGPLAPREFMIPSNRVWDFLEHDSEKIMERHLGTMVPDSLIASRFGDVEMTDSMRQLNEEYDALIEGVKAKQLTSTKQGEDLPEKGQQKQRADLEKERQSVIAAIDGMRNRIRGTYAVPTDAPTKAMARVVAMAKNFNVVVNMGSAVVSSINDLAGPVYRHGLGTVFKEGWQPFFASLTDRGPNSVWARGKAQWSAVGIVVETKLSSRHHSLNDITDQFGGGSRTERALSWGASRFQFVNMMAPFTDFAKTVAAFVSSAEILNATKAVVDGTATPKQLAALHEASITRDLAAKIWENYSRPGAGEKFGEVHLPNTDKWTHAGAREAFENAVSRETNITVVTPGQEKPLWMSTPVLSVLGQFKSFQASATERILVANLQRRDAAALQGALFSMGLGMLSYKLNAMLGGQETSDRPQDWFREGFSRSGMTGWFEEGNAMVSKATRGQADIYRVFGSDKPLSRYASRGALDMVLGPTIGKLDNLMKITGAASKGEWTPADASALRRLMVFQNVFYLRGLINEVEHGSWGPAKSGERIKIYPN